jgi:fatty acid desaturase
VNIAEYRRLLDPVVEPARFTRQRGVLGHLAVHFVLVTGVSSYVATHIGTLPGWAILVLALLAGHSVGVLAFAAHEIGHGAVQLPRHPRWVFEVLGWTYVLFTNPAVQRRAHNMIHHLHGNTYKDPDRRPTLDETAIYKVNAFLTTIIFPNSRMPWFCGVLGFHASICSYHINLLTHSVFKLDTRFNTGMNDRTRAQAALEFAWNASVYAALWGASGFSPWMAGYLWLMYAIATTMDGLYIATNHMLSGYDAEVHDPVAQTVTLKMPAVIDFLHLRFSHHTEHHLYPTAGPSHYPAIRAALKAHFPGRYHELTMPEALRLLFRSPIAIAGPDALAHVDGKGVTPVTFPLGEATAVVPEATPAAVAP